MTAPRIQFRRGTAAQWTSRNPLLRAGEVGYETDTRNVKVGDGVTAWTGLQYSFGPESVAIANAGDVVLTNPQEGEVLVYENGKWRNATLATESINGGNF